MEILQLLDSDNELLADNPPADLKTSRGTTNEEPPKLSDLKTARRETIRRSINRKHSQ
jgi:hypothetical protein